MLYSFPPEVESAARRLVELALAEDLGPDGDRTSEALIPADLRGRAVFVARSSGIVAGVPVAGLVIAAVDPTLKLDVYIPDGTPVERGRRVATISGPLRSILIAERTALNFIQRPSGIATLTQP